MPVVLKENERIDDLERNGYRIIQNRLKFCFGMDAVLLSCFAAEGEKNRAGKHAARARAGRVMRIADLGTGTGIIPILVYGRLCNPKMAEGPGNSKPEEERSMETGKDGLAQFQIDALEIQEEMCDMASRSVQLNGLQSHIHIRQGDICDATQLLGKAQYDVVISNPPYKKRGGGLTNPDDSKAISRHEVLCTFRDVAEQTALLLKSSGRFYLVHRPERLAELVSTMQETGLQIKRIRMVHSYQDSKATMVLIEATRGGGSFLTVEKPLIIYQEKGIYTEEIQRLYYY